jgi:hypothetical protein
LENHDHASLNTCAAAEGNPIYNPKRISLDEWALKSLLMKKNRLPFYEIPLRFGDRSYRNWFGIGYRAEQVVCEAENRIELILSALLWF